MTEGVVAASAAKTVVSEAYQTDGSAGLSTAAAAYDAPAEKPAHASKYVSDIQIDGTGGGITITTQGAGSGLPTEAQGKKIVMTPNIQKKPVDGTLTGAMDWGCASATAGTAATRGLTGITLGDLPAKYAPAECR